MEEIQRFGLNKYGDFIIIANNKLKINGTIIILNSWTKCEYTWTDHYIDTNFYLQDVVNQRK